MGGFAFFASWGFGPGFLKADVDGCVDDGAGRDFGARKEDKLRLVEDSLGLNFRLVGHFM